MHGTLDLERIAALIRRVDPDLVAIQEVDSVTTRTGGVDQAAELARLTGLEPAFGSFMPYRGGAYGMAVLSRWSPESFRNLRLPDGEEPRTAVPIVVRLPRSGQALLAGDFNSTPGSAVMRHLARTWKITGKGADHLTFPSYGPEREIDYVLLRPAGPFHLLRQWLLDEPVASDHRPLAMDVVVY